MVAMLALILAAGVDAWCIYQSCWSSELSLTQLFVCVVMAQLQHQGRRGRGLYVLIVEGARI